MTSAPVGREAGTQAPSEGSPLAAAAAQPQTPDGTALVYRYRYRLTGEIPEPVLAELKLRHQLGNKLVELWKQYRAAVAAAWEDDPHVAPALATLRTAQEKAAAAKQEAARAGQELGYAKQRGITAQVRPAEAAAREARAARRAANAELKQARAAVREVKGLRLNAAQRLIVAARDAYEQGIRDTYSWYHEQGGYWANWSDAVACHRAAAARVAADRARNRPAELRFRRWDGTGTVTVQLQRQLGVTARQRAEVAARKAAGEFPKAIAADLGMTPMAVARMKPDGPEVKGDPPRSPAMLADPASKWRNVAAVSALPPDFAQRRRGERRAAARKGTVTFRTGSEASRAVSQIPAVLHRPMRGDADIAYARITVTRRGPELLMHVSLTAKVPAPQRRAGRLVRVHAGWRVLDDGCLRAAVIAGAGPLPQSLARPAGPGGRASALDGCVRDRGGFWEVIIPRAWREERDRVQGLRSARDKARGTAAADAAAWIQAHPQAASPGAQDGPEPLPPPHMVRQWKAPGKLAALGRRCRDGVHGPQARELGELIARWSVPDRDAWRAEARARARLTARRDDLYGRIAAWITAGAGEIRVDDWDMRTTARRPDPREDDDPQAKAARANRVLAAPGELRSRIRSAAALAGVTVTGWHPGPAGQACHGCGGILDPGQRRASVTVRCGECGQHVDQDANMLALMAGQPGPGGPLPPGGQPG